MKSCSDRPHEAWAWLNEVYDHLCTREKLEEKLQDPGKSKAGISWLVDSGSE